MLLQTCVIIVRGLLQSTTEDTVLNYFENTRRSGGGAVEEVKIEGSVARVKFESSEGNLVVMFTFIKSGDELISRDQLCNFVTKSRLKNLPYFKHMSFWISQKTAFLKACFFCYLIIFEDHFVTCLSCSKV